MMIKFFFLAAASALLMAFNAVQTQFKMRMPSSTLGYTTNVPNTYSYADVQTTFEAAMVNESIHRQNYESLQGMLASEQARYDAARSDIRNIHSIASPYNPISRNIQQLKDQMLRVRVQRERNLDTAYQRLFFTYSSIQMPPTDGSPGLTAEQHLDARKKIEYITLLKQAVHNDGTGIYRYPTYANPYLTAGLFSQDLITPPVVVPDTKVVPVPPAPLQAEAPKPVVEEPKKETLVAEPSREGMVDAILEEPTVAQ